jgi:O-antigen/teichoic acid export membrane protein
MLLGIVLSLYIIKGIKGFFVGQIIVSFALIIYLMLYLLKEYNLLVKNFSISVFKKIITFGYPLVWAELGHLILNYIDRYIIQIYLGAASLGIYTAGYNLATYVTELIIYPINYSMTPIYMKLLTEKGEEETKIFFTTMFNYFLMIIIPVIFGINAISKDLMVIIASDKYTESVIIMKYVVLGQAIYACTIILNSGLFIMQKTNIYNYIMIVTCTINIIMNLIMVKINGIIGAAQATLLSYLFYAIIITYYSFKQFSFRVNIFNIIKYTVSAIIMFILIYKINFQYRILTVTTQIIVGMLIYSIMLFIVDTDMRFIISNYIIKHKT